MWKCVVVKWIYDVFVVRLFLSCHWRFRYQDGKYHPINRLYYATFFACPKPAPRFGSLRFAKWMVCVIVFGSDHYWVFFGFFFLFPINFITNETIIHTLIDRHHIKNINKNNIFRKHIKMYFPTIQRVVPLVILSADSK